MVKPQPNLFPTQHIGRMDIQKVLRPDPGTETQEVWAEFEVQSPALIYARDLHLKSIENLQLTVDVSTEDRAGLQDLYASKTIYNKGRKGNYASIYVWDSEGAVPTGSTYVNILAMGE